MNDVIKMRGSNPFIPSVDENDEIIGKKEELRILDGFINMVGSGNPSMLLIRGVPGSGRSAFLRHLKREAEKAGVFTIYARAEKGEDLSEISKRIYGEMTGVAAGQKKKPSGFAELLPSLVPQEGKRAFGTLLIIDDIDALRKPEESILSMERAAHASQNKVGIAMSTIRTIKRKDLAILELKPLGEGEAKEFVNKSLKDSHVRMGDECISTILSDTGGNPKLFRNVCKLIYDRLRENEKIISKGHYLAYLPAIMAVLSIEWFARAYQETPASERAILAAMAKDEEGIHVSDISRRVGRPMGQVTALMGRLLDSGQIVRLERGKYRIFSKLYARYVLQRG